MTYESTQVCIFLLNYNSTKYTIDCVESIVNKTKASLDYHIVIIDNGSIESEFEQLKSSVSGANITLVRSEENLGFFGGYHIGIKYAPKSEYYYFLNNDCLLVNDVASILFDFCEKNPNVGICSGQMLDPELRPVRSFNYLPTLSLRIFGNALLRVFNPKKFPKRSTDYSAPIKVGIVSGSSIFVRKSALDNVGGLDLNYFLYCEEEELGFAMNTAGYDVYFHPKAKFVHYFGASTKFDQYRRDKEYHISLFYFYKKNYGMLYKIANQWFLAAKFLCKGIGNVYNLKLALFLIMGAKSKRSLKNVSVNNTSTFQVNIALKKVKLKAS